VYFAERRTIRVQRVKFFDPNNNAAVQQSTAQRRAERTCAMAGTVSPTAHAARFLGTSGFFVTCRSFVDWKIATEEQAP
jgi:hypothetical protein